MYNYSPHYISSYTKFLLLLSKTVVLLVSSKLSAKLLSVEKYAAAWCNFYAQSRNEKNCIKTVHIFSYILGNGIFSL